MNGDKNEIVVAKVGSIIDRKRAQGKLGSMEDWKYSISCLEQ